MIRIESEREPEVCAEVLRVDGGSVWLEMEAWPHEFSPEGLIGILIENKSEDEVQATIRIIFGEEEKILDDIDVGKFGKIIVVPTVVEFKGLIKTSIEVSFLDEWFVTPGEAADMVSDDDIENGEIIKGVLKV